MPNLRLLAGPLLPVIAASLRRCPLKTRIGGVTTLLTRIFGLSQMHESRQAKLRNGLRIPVQLSDHNGRMLYLFGTPDPKVVEVCSTLLRPGDVFLDIGANHGAVGLMSHDRVLPGGAVHFVEPQHELCEVIRDAIDRYEISHASVHECGLWDEDGEMTLKVREGHSGAARFMGKLAGASEIRVPVRSIDAFFQEHVGSRPFGAKIDVEGAEVKILPAILGHPSLRFAVFECKAPGMADSYWEQAAAAGFTLFGLRMNLLTTRLEHVAGPADLGRFVDAPALRMDAERIPRGPVHPRVLAPLAP